MAKIKTYTELYIFAQEMGMLLGDSVPENVVIRVEVEFYEYRQMIQDCHRAVYSDLANVKIYENRDKRPSFTVKIGRTTFLVSMEEPTYNFKL